MTIITGWGRGTWNEGSWGSDLPVIVSGSQLQTTTDTVSILLGQIVDLSTNLLQTTVGTFSFEITGSVNLSTNLINLTTGAITSKVDIDVSTSTNLLQITLGDESGIGNAIINLSTNILNTTIGAYSITADGNTSEIVVGASMNSTVNVIDASAGNIEEVTGQTLTLSLGDETLTGDGTVTLSTNLLNATTDTAIVDVATLVLTGTSLSTTSGTVTFTIDGSVAVTGVNMTTSTGRLFITAWAVVDIGVTNTWSVVDIAA